MSPPRDGFSVAQEIEFTSSHLLTNLTPPFFGAKETGCGIFPRVPRLPTGQASALTRRGQQITMTNGSLGSCRTSNKKLIAWVEEQAKLCTPDRVFWCDGSDAENQIAVRSDGQERHVHQAQRKEAPGLLPRPLASQRRGPRRGSHLHLLANEGRSRSDQPLGRSGRDEAEAARPVQGLHERAHDVRDSVRHGPARLAHLQDRHRDHRFALRRGQHAHHDAHGPGGARQARAPTARSFPACTRSARRCSPARRTCPGRANRIRRRNTSSISPTTRRSGPTAPVTAATRCSARNASRCASRRWWPERKAGWPNTCSSSASRRRRAKSITSPPPSRAPAARPISP